MARRLKKKVKIKGFSEISEDIEAILPRMTYVVKLECEETKFLLIYKDSTICVLMSLDDLGDTVVIPLSEFNKRVYNFEVGGTKYSTKIHVFQQEGE